MDRRELESFKALIDAGADITLLVPREYIYTLREVGGDYHCYAIAYGSTNELNRAIFKHNKEDIEKLSGAASLVHQADSQGITPLMAAARESKGPLVVELLRKGGDVHARDKVGQTVLHFAVRGDCPRAPQRTLFDALIEAGTAINASDNYGITPLTCAVKDGKLHLVQYFSSKKGINFEIQKYADTALIEAVNKCHVAVVECLLKGGASPNTPCILFNRTALHHALIKFIYYKPNAEEEGAYEKIIMHLLDYHADITQKDKDGQNSQTLLQDLVDKTKRETDAIKRVRQRFALQTKIASRF